MLHSFSYRVSTLLAIVKQMFIFFYPGGLGFNKRIEYEPGTGSLALFPSMHLEEVQRGSCSSPDNSLFTARPPPRPPSQR